MDLSILLVTYNQEKYIRESLDSILMQDLPDSCEIVIADDHSTDNTPDIIKKVLDNAKVEYRMLQSHANIGINKNYQRGFKACSGKFVAVMEGDDYWTDPFRIKKHIQFLEVHRECVLSFNRIIVFNQNNNHFFIPDWTSCNDFEYITSNQLASGSFIGNMSACVYRNSALKKLKDNFYDLGIMADWGMGVALGRFGLIAKLKEGMSVHRVHNQGYWNNRSANEKHLTFYNKLDQYNAYFENDFHKEFMGFKRKLWMKKHRIPGFLRRYVSKIIAVIPGYS